MTNTEACPCCSYPTRVVHKSDHAWGECPRCGEYFEVPHYEDEG